MIKPYVIAPEGAKTGVPFVVKFGAPDRYDNLFLEVSGPGFTSWPQVRYSTYILTEKEYTVHDPGQYVARLRQPKYAAGHNKWPILAEVAFDVALSE